MPQLPERLPLIGGYRFEEQLGKGGMGAVYAARDLRLQRQVAIKLLPINKTQTPSVALHEARAMARVNHNHVVQIFDVIETSDHIALVMEYLEGQTLMTLQRQQLLTLEQKIGVLLQIAEGLQAIHKAGLIHADVKPQNIWVTPDYQIKVLDLGIARVPTDNTPKQPDPTENTSGNDDKDSPPAFSSMGSENYASPEQKAGQPLEARSDIYSFGVMSFELLAGRLPFNTKHHATPDPEHKIDLEDASHIFPPLPQALIDLINTMLYCKISERPKNISAIAAKLNQINKDLLQAAVIGDLTRQLNVPDESIAAASASTVQKTQKTRTPTHYSIAIAGFSLILFALVAVMMYWQPANNRSTNNNDDFIVALEPIISLSKDFSPEEQDVIVASVDDAIIQTLLALENYTVIDRQSNNQDLLTNDLNFKAIGKQLGADELVSSQINCTKQRCQVSINRIRVENGRVLSRLQNYLPPLKT